MAVVEVIMVERGKDGVVKGQYSLGWALLPMFQVRCDGWVVSIEWIPFYAFAMRLLC
jgi:hypothetical protein